MAEVVAVNNRDTMTAFMHTLPHAVDVGNVPMQRANEVAFAAVMRVRNTDALAAILEDVIRTPCVLEFQRAANLISVYVQTGRLPKTELRVVQPGRSADVIPIMPKLNNR